MINLSPKATRFVVEALKFRIDAYREQLDNQQMSEDKTSDITNDLMFLESLLEELKSTLSASISQVF